MGRVEAGRGKAPGLKKTVTRIFSGAETGNCAASLETQAVRAMFLLRFWIRKAGDRRGLSGSHVDIGCDWEFHTERRGGEAGRGI